MAEKIDKILKKHIAYRIHNFRMNNSLTQKEVATSIDIAFIKINGDNRVGIISNIDDETIYIILGNYDRTGIVKEIYVSKSSGILTGSYAHIKMPDAVSMINSNSIYAIGNGYK